MNVNFKVLWFEDEMGWRPSSERSMKKIIESHNLVPIITWKKGDEGDAEEELKKEYDLILMDYELRGTMGNILIKKLRQFDIYTDVVFYSGNYNKMVKALYNIDEKGMNIEPVDGIYFSDRKREELFPKLQKVVDKVVRRMQDIVNLRGVATVYKGNIIKNLIMDCQSYTKYRPNETTGGIFVSWRRKEELPTGA